MIVAHLREPAPYVASRVQGLAPVLDQILQRCLAKSPGDRFQSMIELANALGQAEQAFEQPGSAPHSAATVVARPYATVPMQDVPTPMHGSPTTLSGAASQTAARSSGRWGWIAAGVVTIAGAAVAVVLATRGGKEDQVAASPPETPVEVRADAAPVAVATPIDAPAAIVAAPVDASVPVAVDPTLPVSVDAGTPTSVGERPKPHRPKHTSTNKGEVHADPPKGTTPPDINRGD